MTYINLDNNVTEKATIIATCRRHVLAAMETGQEGVARTIITELREFDHGAATDLRMEVVKAYGTDI